MLRQSESRERRLSHHVTECISAAAPFTDGTTDKMKDHHPMPNLTLFIIRHAEKPDEAWPGPGLTEDGQSDNKSLVIRGWHRAGSWAALFGGSYRDFPAPGAIYAASPVTGAGEEVSQRPLQTVRPLAERLHLTPIRAMGPRRRESSGRRCDEADGRRPGLLGAQTDRKCSSSRPPRDA